VKEIDNGSSPIVIETNLALMSAKDKEGSGFSRTFYRLIYQRARKRSLSGKTQGKQCRQEGVVGRQTTNDKRQTTNDKRRFLLSVVALPFFF
jgi:hypothetical protein